MTDEEKETIKDLFEKFKGLYNRQKISDDLLNRIIPHLNIAELNKINILRWQESNSNITERDLAELEEKINNL